MAAREVRRVRAEDGRRIPWKNGRGVTREIALGPEGASFERGDFDWRVSTARIEEAGPFSDFAGFDRILVITEGDGVVLEHGSAAPRARARRLEPYRFCGDWPTRCEPVRGPVADFNVLTRRGKVTADVMAVQLGSRRLREPIAASCALLHTVGEGLVVRVSGEEDSSTLAAGESLLLSNFSGHDELDCTGASERTTLLLVRIR